MSFPRGRLRPQAGSLLCFSLGGFSGSCFHPGICSFVHSSLTTGPCFFILQLTITAVHPAHTMYDSSQPSRLTATDSTHNDENT